MRSTDNTITLSDKKVILWNKIGEQNLCEKIVKMLSFKIWTFHCYKVCIKQTSGHLKLS